MRPVCGMRAATAAWSISIFESATFYIWRGFQGENAREGPANGDLQFDNVVWVSIFCKLASRHRQIDLRRKRQ